MLRVRWRAWAIALALLVLLDVGIRTDVVRPPFPEDFRMPARTLMGYREFVAHMRDASGARIAVVGDSIVAGQFADASGTLSAHLSDLYRSRGGAARAYNFGLPGAQANDLAAIVGDISSRRAADVVVLNIDYRFYDVGVPSRRYPGITDWKSDWLAPFWALHQHRDAFAAATLGETPKRTLVNEQLRVRLALSGDELYRKRREDQIDAAALKDAFDVAPFSEETPAVRSLGEGLDAARAAGIPVIVFMGPLDSGLLDRKGVMDWSAYEANLVWMRAYVERRGATWVDLTREVPAADIADSHHPLSAGYRIMAEKLIPVIDPLLPVGDAR